MSVIGVGVIGLGEMGQTHSAIYANLPQTRLVAVFDVDPERTRSIAERYAATACATFADVLAHPDVDAVSICTPDDQHYDAPCKRLTQASISCWKAAHDGPRSRTPVG
jgi:predicted dehydrogenase